MAKVSALDAIGRDRDGDVQVGERPSVVHAGTGPARRTRAGPLPQPPLPRRVDGMPADHARLRERHAVHVRSGASPRAPGPSPAEPCTNGPNPRRRSAAVPASRPSSRTVHWRFAGSNAQHAVASAAADEPPVHRVVRVQSTTRMRGRTEPDRLIGVGASVQVLPAVRGRVVRGDAARDAGDDRPLRRVVVDTSAGGTVAIPQRPWMFGVSAPALDQVPVRRSKSHVSVRGRPVDRRVRDQAGRRRRRRRRLAAAPGRPGARLADRGPRVGRDVVGPQLGRTSGSRDSARPPRRRRGRRPGRRPGRLEDDDRSER